MTVDKTSVAKGIHSPSRLGVCLYSDSHIQSLKQMP